MIIGHHKNLDTIGKQNYQEPGAVLVLRVCRRRSLYRMYFS